MRRSKTSKIQPINSKSMPRVRNLPQDNRSIIITDKFSALPWGEQFVWNGEKAILSKTVSGYETSKLKNSKNQDKIYIAFFPHYNKSYATVVKFNKKEFLNRFNKEGIYLLAIPEANIIVRFEMKKGIFEQISKRSAKR